MPSVSRLSALAAVTAIPFFSARAEEPKGPPSAVLELPTIEVIGVMPLPGLGVPRNQVPSNVQAVTGADIQRSQSASLPEFMASQLPSVTVNEVQGNPFQVDLSYRGFSASPRFGVAQGVSVYLDGVRMNEPFGDVVNWDLIPQLAISSMNLIPGSNPLFGLNTLGGAISLRTKSGENYPGLYAQAYGGSFGRRAAEFEYGGRKDELGWYVAVERFKEDGWRDFSPSDLTRFFAKAGWQRADADIDLSILHADTDLTGTQLVPLSMYNRRREIAFTIPDITKNRLTQITLTGSRSFGESNQLTADIYHRTSRRRTLNGDLNEGFEGNPALDGAEGANDGIGLSQDAARNNRTTTNQRGYGFSGQWTRYSERNRLTIGFGYDESKTDFVQGFALGSFDADRGVSESAAELRNASLDGSIRTTSAYFTDTLNLAQHTHLTLSGRYYVTRVKNNDKLNRTAPNLDADFTYRKFNPAVGLTHNPNQAWTLYAGYSQGSRTPSPIELGCADANNPCTLPNAFASDPFLKQVVARTLEAGMRGKLAPGMNWNAGVFRTESRDDIIFVSTSRSTGFFTNFGTTRRQGIEAAISGATGAWKWSAGYSLVDATFRSSAFLLSANNSSRGTAPGAADDEIRVSSGNRIPGIPRHSLKLLAEYGNSQWAVGGTLAAFSSQFVQGNENNQHSVGASTDSFGNTRAFEGSGKAPGYGVINLYARYEFAPGWQVFGRLNNLFDKKYFTAGALAENPFNAAGVFQTNSDAWIKETFFAPGAPRAVWVGVRYAMSEKR
jgi:outer membrane receptor protein involved in Fe transport